MWSIAHTRMGRCLDKHGTIYVLNLDELAYATHVDSEVQVMLRSGARFTIDMQDKQSAAELVTSFMGNG